MQVPRIGRDLEVGRCFELLSVSDERFDVCLRRERFLREPGGVHHLYHKSRRKPHSPIRRVRRSIEGRPACRPRPIQDVVNTRLNHRFGVGPPTLELGIWDLHDATASVQPQAILFVLDERNYRVAGQTVFRRHPVHLTLSPFHKSVIGTGKNGTICRRHNLAIKRIASRVQRKLRFKNAVPEQSEISFLSSDPNSSVWVRSEAVSRRDLRRRELFTHLEITDAHQLSRIA